MNNLCTLLNNLSKNVITQQQFDDLGNLIATVVRDELGRDSKSLLENWADADDDYIDFTFALRPDWLFGTPDGKQVKMRISIEPCDQSWYAHMVMDCDDGEIAAWGEKEFNSTELEECSMPVKSMLEVIHCQYDKKLREESTKTADELDKAAQVAKQLQQHVDAIKNLCIDNKLNIYADRGLDGASCLYLVPDSMRRVNGDYNGEVINIEKIPHLDFGARGFDPYYDFFIR